MYDLLLRGGDVIDGSKAPRRRADVAIVGERIAAVGDLAEAQAREVVDVTGRIVAPGFVDVHNHSDGWLLRRPNFVPKTHQGFTTEVLMADGISYAPVNAFTWRAWMFYLRSLNALRLEEYRGWQTLDDYLSLLDRRTAQNVIAHVPYANVRTIAAGFTRHPPDDFQRRTIREEIRRGMEAGCVGLSTGLDYMAQHFAPTEEIVHAATAIAEFNGLYVTHIRYKAGLLVALEEAIEIGRRAGVRVHISHLKGTTPQEVEQVLALVDRARREVDLSFDVYPYQRGSTMLNFLLPYEVWEAGPLEVLARMGRDEMLARFSAGLDAMGLGLDKFHIAWTASWDNSAHHGQTLADYVAETGRPAAEALYHLLIEENLATLLVIDSGDDALVRPLLQHDLYVMGSDGIYFPDSMQHPRVIGSAGRLLGPCVREWGLFSLEDAVFKLSAGPARRFGLRDRGEVRPRAFADLVVFDPETVADQADYHCPQQLCTGFEQVLVNGAFVIKDGQPQEFAGACPGRRLWYEPES